MKNRNLIFGFITFSIVATVFIISMQSSLISAATSAGTYCAEKTTYGAACQNVPFNQVNTSFNYAPTSCDSTTFCKSGTCVSPGQGTCLPNTASSTCQGEGGVWYDQQPSSVPLCQQGCCLIGDQAAFVTQARCKQLSSFYNMPTTFRSDINDQASCIASAEPQAKGACVYETNAGRTCKFTTKQDCQTMATSGSQNATFHMGNLCSNPKLGTDCSPTTQTTCLNGQDQVYFVDSCGNPANVYDASKEYNKNNPQVVNYWSYMPGYNGVNVSLNPSNAAESSTNGNCNYYLGSTCRQYNAAIDGASNKPTGDYICRSLDCSSGAFATQFSGSIGAGRTPYNGETWCGTLNGSSSTGVSFDGSNQGLQGNTVGSLSKPADLPGSGDVRFVCYNGQITTESCAGYRQQICQQGGNSSSEFYASCVVNKWRDCYSQTNQQDCLNTAQRNCKWVTGISILKDSNGDPLVVDDSSGNPTLVAPANSTDQRTQASCVPMYTPGLSSSNAQQVCSLASTNCIVTFASTVLGSNKGIVKTGATDLFGISVGGKAIITCFNNNGTKVVNSWINDQANLCMALGDCGASNNSAGYSGYNSVKDLYTVVQNADNLNSTNSSS